MLLFLVLCLMSMSPSGSATHKPYENGGKGRALVASSFPASLNSTSFMTLFLRCAALAPSYHPKNATNMGDAFPS